MTFKTEAGGILPINGGNKMTEKKKRKIMTYVLAITMVMTAAFGFYLSANAARSRQKWNTGSVHNRPCKQTGELCLEYI